MVLLVWLVEPSQSVFACFSVRTSDMVKPHRNKTPSGNAQWDRNHRWLQPVNYAESRSIWLEDRFLSPGFLQSISSPECGVLLGMITVEPDTPSNHVDHPM